MIVTVPASWIYRRPVLFAARRLGPDDPRVELHFSTVPAIRWWARPLVLALVALRTFRPNGRA